jgi:hypothetical protein
MRGFACDRETIRAEATQTSLPISGERPQILPASDFNQQNSSRPHEDAHEDAHGDVDEHAHEDA